MPKSKSKPKSELITTHNFEKTLAQIDEFSKQAEQQIEISKVDTEGSWLCFTDHNVTGAELNDVISQIEENFIALKNHQIELVREFEQVYAAFNSLDKDYIDAINNNISSVEEVSNQAYDASQQAHDAAKRAEDVQKKIKKTVDTQKTMVDALSKHVDKFQQSMESINAKFNDLREADDAAKKQVEKIEKKAESLRKSIATMQKENNNITSEVNECVKQINSERTAMAETVAALNKKCERLQIIAASAIVLGIAGLICGFSGVFS